MEGYLGMWVTLRSAQSDRITEYIYENRYRGRSEIIDYYVRAIFSRRDRRRRDVLLKLEINEQSSAVGKSKTEFCRTIMRKTTSRSFGV